jgi:hypothetical protein
VRRTGSGEKSAERRRRTYALLLDLEMDDAHRTSTLAEGRTNHEEGHGLRIEDAYS